MVKCSFCDIDIDYLPFKCRYCGEQFCTKHRLPENHECSFKYKNDPYTAKNLVPRSSHSYPSHIESTSYDLGSSSDAMGGEQRGASRGRSLINPFKSKTNLKATYSLMLIQFIVYLLILIPGVDQFFFLSTAKILSATWLYSITLITSIFNPGNIISLIFNLIIIYFIGKTVEGRFGWKIFLQVYVVSGIITGLMTIVLQLVFGSIPQFSAKLLEDLTVGFDTTAGATIGLIAFMILLLP
ncbi:MAG: rhomboid family intramembrane serine protease, partial [Candidatus Lokiarchaeota archaeon]|nr:rhomboid family intramembrane serine protease [Candidatus Lokiarchaeota archaeon]